jgi:hypothetical protein
MPQREQRGGSVAGRFRERRLPGRMSVLGYEIGTGRGLADSAVIAI